MTPTVSTPPAEAERIELNGGWYFKRIHPGREWFELHIPTGQRQLRPWSEEEARAFAATQRPAAPVDRAALGEALWNVDTIRFAVAVSISPWADAGKVWQARFRSFADEMLAHLSAHPRVAVPEELRKLSEAATPGEWKYGNCILVGRPRPEVGGRTASKLADRTFARAAVNFVRSLLPSHPTTDAGSVER